MDFKEYDGKVVSILVTGRNNRLESYSGTFRLVNEVLCRIVMNNPNSPIEHITLKTELILSIWLYLHSKVDKKYLTEKDD